MNASQNCINLITKYEGCRLTAYKDAVGVWSIGYGHTSDVYAGQNITNETAIAFLKLDIIVAENAVNKYITKYQFNQNQYDALVSFAFNIGSINQLTANGTRTIAQISAKIPAYNKAGGKVLNGLVKRRAEEKALFDKEISIPTTNKETVKSEVPDYVIGRVYTTDATTLKVHLKPTLSSTVVRTYPKGTRCTCKSKVVDVYGNVWIKTPSGWCCGYLISKDEVYIK